MANKFTQKSYFATVLAVIVVSGCGGGTPSDLSLEQTNTAAIDLSEASNFNQISEIEVVSANSQDNPIVLNGRPVLGPALPDIDEDNTGSNSQLVITNVGSMTTEPSIDSSETSSPTPEQNVVSAEVNLATEEPSVATSEVNSIPPEPGSTEANSTTPEPDSTEANSTTPEPDNTEVSSTAPEPDRTEANSTTPEPDNTEANSTTPELGTGSTETGSSVPEPENTETDSTVDPDNTDENSTSIAPTFEPLRIFPGAEGFGAKSSGGRGGVLCFVTNTNDTGEGSFRDCVERSGKRIVIFKTGGTIEVDSAIDIDDPYISIYGQSAPGDGILIRASLDSKSPALRIRTHDVLMQHVRVRAGSSRLVSCCRDAVAIGSGTSGEVYNIVLDHNSFTWGLDEIVDIWFDSHDITLSYNIIAESLHDNGSNDEGPAGRGLLIGANGAHSISLHHNYIAHSYQRNPLIKTSGIVDITSNLIYHHISRGGQHDDKYGGQEINWVKNQYIPLLDNEDDTKVTWGDILLIHSNNDTSAYFEGNLGYHRTSLNQPEWAIAHSDWNTPYDPSLGYHSDTRFPAPPITETDAADLESILPAIVGATQPTRSPVDTRIIDQLANRSGRLLNCVEQEDRPGEARCANNAGGWPVLSPGNAPNDQDSDGIPDQWEIDHGLDPSVFDSDQDINNDGFTNLEDWVHRGL